jgi:hypothetical protein
MLLIRQLFWKLKKKIRAIEKTHIQIGGKGRFRAAAAPSAAKKPKSKQCIYRSGKPLHTNLQSARELGTAALHHPTLPP